MKAVLEPFAIARTETQSLSSPLLQSLRGGGRKEKGGLSGTSEAFGVGTLATGLL